MNRADWQQ